MSDQIDTNFILLLIGILLGSMPVIIIIYKLVERYNNKPKKITNQYDNDYTETNKNNLSDLNSSFKGD
jgi:hypothetical protein